MKKLSIILVSILLLSSLYGAERIEPLDVYILVDKSISMEESGAFNDVKEWMSAFIDKSLIQGDTVHLYFFYGDTNKVFSQQLSSETDFTALKNIVTQTRADGAFTDIGLALDTVKQRIADSQSSKKTVALILTDLIQEASYSSKYAGTYYDFAQRYLTEDRIISHGGSPKSPLWYEISVQIAELRTIEQRAQKIYNVLKNTTKEPLYKVQNRDL